MVWNPEEERLRRQWAEAIRNGRASPAQPGMINQSVVTPEMMERAAANPKAKELALQMQNQWAQQLRNTALPEGRTAGDIYVASNPLETLGTVANQAVGAIAARKIRGEGLPELEQAYKDQTMAGLEIDEARNQQSLEQTAIDRDIAAQQHREKMEQQWASTEPLEAVDTTGQGRPPLFARQTPEGLVDTQTGELIPEGYQLRDDPNLFGSRGGKGGATPKNPRRWRDIEGNEYYTIDVGTDIIDQFTGEVINDKLREGKFFEESSISGSSRNSAIQKLVKDTSNLRSLATDYNDMLETFEKYDIDLLSGDDPLGRFEKAEGTVGTLTRMLKDAAEPGAETGEIYSAIRGVLNSVIRNQAGMSQTVAEIEKLNTQYGSRWQDDPAIMANALSRLAPKIKEDIAANVTAMDDTSLELYRKRLNEFGAPDWTQWGQKAPGKLPDEPETEANEERKTNFPSTRGTRSGRGIGGKKSELDAIDEEIRRLEEELRS